MSRVIGIDPGISGAIALIPGSRPPELFDLPVASIGSTKQISVQQLANIISGWGQVDAVFIEDNRAQSINGSKANFSMGLSIGICLGVCQTLSRPIRRIKPREWQVEFKLGKIAAAERKNAHRERAIELWPDMYDSLKRVKDHNRADALLIAEAGRRSL